MSSRSEIMIPVRVQQLFHRPLLSLIDKFPLGIVRYFHLQLRIILTCLYGAAVKRDLLFISRLRLPQVVAIKEGPTMRLDNLARTYLQDLEDQEDYDPPMAEGSYLGFYIPGGTVILKRIEQLLQGESPAV